MGSEARAFTVQGNKNYINISVDEYNAVIAENTRLQMELKQATEELNRRRTVEEVAGVLMQQFKEFATDSKESTPKEIQIPAFMIKRAAGGRR